MKRIAQLMLSSVLLSLLVGCSNQNNNQLNQEVISSEQPISQSQHDSNEPPVDPDYVGAVKSLTFSEDKQKLINILSPTAHFFTLEVDKDKVNYISFSLYLLQDGAWQHRPITLIDVHNENEFDTPNFAYDLLSYELLNPTDENKDTPIEVIGKLHLFDDAMDSTFSLSFPFEFKPFDGSLGQINGISSEVIYPKLNQETIICYRLSVNSEAFYSPHTYDFDSFKESNELSGNYNQGIVLTINYTDTIPTAFQ